MEFVKLSSRIEARRRTGSRQRFESLVSRAACRETLAVRCGGSANLPLIQDARNCCLRYHSITLGVANVCPPSLAVVQASRDNAHGVGEQEERQGYDEHVC